MDKHTVSFSLQPKPKRALRLLYQDYNVQQRCRPKCPRVGGLPVRGFRSSTAATSASAAAEPVDAHASNHSSTTHEQQDPAVGASDADAHGAHVHSPSALMEEEYFDLPLPAGAEQEDNAATAKKQSYDSEGNWQEFMQAAPGVYLDTLPQQLQLLQDQSSWLLSRLNAAVSSGECPTCGLSTEECKILKCVDVFVFDISNCCKVTAPIFECPRCKAAHEHGYNGPDMPQPQPQPQQQHSAHGSTQQQQQQQQQQLDELDVAGAAAATRSPYYSPLHFNLHPFSASCFPATPVHGVYLYRAPAGKVPIWFTLQLLHHLYTQRQWVQRLAMHKAAAAQMEFLQKQLYSRFPAYITKDRFRKALAVALDHYASLNLCVQQRAAVGLEPEGLVDCCAACSHGHLELLPQLNPQLNVRLTTGEVHSSSADAASTAGSADPSTAAAAAATPPESGNPAAARVDNAEAATETAAANASAAPAAAASAPGSPAAADAAAAKNSADAAPAGAGAAAAAMDESVAAGFTGSSAAARINHTGMPSLQRSKYGRPAVTHYIHSVMLDGTQKLRHFARAGRKSGRRPQFVQRLQPDMDFKLWSGVSPEDVEADASTDPDPCHTFKADQAVGRRSDMFDQNGIITLLCRHGALLAAMNMPTGERWAYAIYLLHVLMHEHNTLPYVVMYDINCRFKGHFLHWAEQQSAAHQWSPEAQQWAQNKMQMPLPPFHQHMHMAACQPKNSLRMVRGGGTGIGEPTEQMNRYLGLAGVVLQYAMLGSRALWIEVLFHQWNLRKRHDLPRLLVSTACRAQAALMQLTEKRRKLGKLALTTARELQYQLDIGEVKAWGLCAAVQDISPPVIALPWDAEAAELTVQLQSFTWHDSNLLPSHLVGADLGLKESDINRRQQRLQSLKAQHPEIQCWAPDSDGFCQALYQLCSCKVTVWQHQLEKMSSEYAQAQWFQSEIGDTSRKEHKLLRKELQKLSSSLNTGLHTLVAWEAERLRYEPHKQASTMDEASPAAQVPAGMAPAAAQSSAAADPTAAAQPAAAADATAAWHTLPTRELLEQLQRGELPWAAANAAAASKLPTRLAHIKMQMQVLAYKLRAAQHEQRIIEHEMKGYQLSMQREIEQLTAAMQVQVQHSSQSCHQMETLEEQLSAATSAEQHDIAYQRCCVIKAASRSHSIATARLLLLQQRLNAATQLLSKAVSMFNKYSSDSSSGCMSAIAAAAATAVAEQLAAVAGHDEADSDDSDDVATDDVGDADDGMVDAAAGEVTGQEAACSTTAAAAATAAAAGAASATAAGRPNGGGSSSRGNTTTELPQAAAAGSGTVPATAPRAPLPAASIAARVIVPLQPIRSYQPSAADNAVVKGALPLRLWGDQLPPWQASDATVAQLQQLQLGIWPASLAALEVAGGSITLPHKARIEAADILRLRTGKWLNDELVNIAMWWLQQQDAALQGHAIPMFGQQLVGMCGVSCHFFTSHFMPKLYLDDRVLRYSRQLARWTLPASLRRAGQARHAGGVLSCSLVIAPVNLDNRHWVLVVADLDRHQIYYIDPYGGDRPDITDAMAFWVREEARDKLLQWWDTDSWKRVRLVPGQDIPQQEDGHSCGLYVAVLASCLGAGVPLQHCQMTDADAVAVRARLLDNICTMLAVPPS